MPGEDALLELIGRLYDAAYDRSRWPAFLDRFRGDLGANNSCLLMFDYAADEAVVFDMAGGLADEKHRRNYEEHYWRTDTWRLAVERWNPAEAVFVSQALISDRDFERSEFWNDYLQPVDCFHSGGLIHYGGSVRCALSAQRSRRQERFGDEDLRLFQALAPHFRRALSIDRKLRSVRLDRDAAGGVVERAPFGVIFLDARGRVLAMNRAAESILARGDALFFGAEGVEARHPRDNGALQRLLAGALAVAGGGSIDGGGVLAVSRRSGAPPLSLIAAPLPRRQFAFDLGGPPAAVVIVSDPATEADMPAEALVRLYGLTAAEARLALALAAGSSLAQAADALGVTAHTARGHLKQVFRKTMTRRQAELVRLLLTSVPAVAAKENGV